MDEGDPLLAPLIPALRKARINQVASKSTSLFLNQKGQVTDNMDQLRPTENIAFSLDGESKEVMPFDIANKTVEELREIGFQDMMDVNFKPSPRTGELKPVLSHSEKQGLEEALEQLNMMKDGLTSEQSVRQAEILEKFFCNVDKDR